MVNNCVWVRRSPQYPLIAEQYLLKSSALECGTTGVVGSRTPNNSYSYSTTVQFNKAEIESLKNTQQLQAPANIYDGYPLMLQLFRDEINKEMVIYLYIIPLIEPMPLVSNDYYKGSLPKATVNFMVSSVRVGSQELLRNSQVCANYTHGAWNSSPVCTLRDDTTVYDEEEKVVIQITILTQRHKIR